MKYGRDLVTVGVLGGALFLAADKGGLLDGGPEPHDFRSPEPSYSSGTVRTTSPESEPDFQPRATKIGSIILDNKHHDVTRNRDGSYTIRLSWQHHEAEAPNRVISRQVVDTVEAVMEEVHGEPDPSTTSAVASLTATCLDGDKCVNRSQPTVTSIVRLGNTAWSATDTAVEFQGTNPTITGETFDFIRQQAEGIALVQED